MTSESSPSEPPSWPAAAERPMSAGQKSAVTARRRKAERREERLRDIRAQAADGSLIIRQMTDEQHEAAGEAARQVRSRHEARRRRYSPLGG